MNNGKNNVFLQQNDIWQKREHFCKNKKLKNIWENNKKIYNLTNFMCRSN